MGVRTQADERIEEASSCVRRAEDAIREVLTGKCWGHNDYGESFLDGLEEQYLAILKVMSWFRKRGLD